MHMVERPLNQTSRPVRPALALARVLALAASAVSAQVAPPPPPPPPSQSAPPSSPQGPVLAVSMEQAVAMALESNLGLKADRMNLDLAAQGIADQMIDAPCVLKLPVAVEPIEATLGFSAAELLVHERR